MPTPKLPAAALEYFRSQGSIGGKKGSKKLTPETARKMVAAREAKRKLKLKGMK